MYKRQCLDHEDLEGNTTIQMLPGYEANTVTDHGAAVAGIIAAADNNIGLRGDVYKRQV